MECKFGSKCGKLAVTAELIDTLWNVNNNKFIFCTACPAELIDTLWNVNGG